MKQIHMVGLELTATGSGVKCFNHWATEPPTHPPTHLHKHIHMDTTQHSLTHLLCKKEHLIILSTDFLYLGRWLYRKQRNK